MSNIFEIFDPGLRHWKRQQELEKTLIVPGALGGTGPVQVDLDKGTIVLRPRSGASTDAEETSEHVDTEAGARRGLPEQVDDPAEDAVDSEGGDEPVAPRRAAHDQA